jgi:hypothetical protein
MLLRSTGWLCTATICQLFVPAAHSQVLAASPTPAPSPALPSADSESWKVEESNELVPPSSDQQPMGQRTETPVEQEPGWSGGLLDQPDNQTGQEPLLSNETGEEAPAPVDPRSKGYGVLFGVVDVRPEMSFGVTYDDNILISSSNPKRDVVYTISPGVLLGLGDYLVKENDFLRVEYIPSLTLFNHYSNINSLDHFLRIEGQYALGPLMLGGSFEYDKFSGPDRDVGGRINRDVYTVDLSASYTISDKASIDTDTAVWFRHYRSQIGSTEIINHNWLNYNLSPKLITGAGVAVGWLQPESGGGRQIYEQVLARLLYPSSEKLTFSANAGVEFREFSAAGTRVTPVFGLNASYQLSPGTKISISGLRRTTNSAALNGQNYTATSISVDLLQHLIGDFYLTLGGGYENDAYRNTTSTSNTTATTVAGGQRQDNYYYIRPGLTYRPKDWVSVSLSYFYQTDNSNSPTNSFRDRQLQLEVRLGF